MIDIQNAPKWWLIEGRVQCAAHAEKRFGAGLYRYPRPRGRDGRPIEPLPDGDGGPCAVCNETHKRWDVV